MTDELPKEEAERRAREVAQRMLTTPKPRKATSQKGDDSVHAEVMAIKARLRADLEDTQRELAITDSPAETKRLREKVRDLRRLLNVA